MELEGVVRGEGDEEATGEIFGEGVAVIVEEEGVVTEGGHRNPDLSEVVEVLQYWSLKHTTKSMTLIINNFK